MRAIGLILQAAYRLRRHRWLGWSLARWWGVLTFLAGVVVLLRWWSRPWHALLPAILFVAHVVLLIWAAQRRYVHFQATPAPGEREAASPLRVEEMVPVRASGWFTVEGQNRYFVDLPADLETVPSREHIVLARVEPSRFLLLGTWPTEELGWWYVFFQSAMIQRMRWGHLYVGARPQRALQVVYAPDEETRQTVYLAADDAATLQRLWDDLMLDAPPEVRSTAQSTGAERGSG